ncbi:MAG: tRNA lysidine(34) synthetase TilS [Eubacterium sp.]|nr:tRNA lysidine(34) synthetase TilS [Eubacterium sp.]
MKLKVYEFIKEKNIIQEGESVVLGVSGGADSICMLFVMNELKEQLKIKISVVHVNHMIRGMEAEQDAKFVEKYCKKLGVPFYLERVNVPKLSSETGMTEEEAGRKVRYDIYRKYLTQLKADKVAVAHNQNDNAETILFNLFRGSGVKGLTGIPAKRDYIVRPLLNCTRAEIEKYLEKHQLDYCNDCTNNITDYTRNKIRLELFPWVRENINKRAEYNIVNAAENLRDIADLLDLEVKRAYEKYVIGETIRLEAFQLPRAILTNLIRRAIGDRAAGLKDITRTHIEMVMKLSKMQVSRSVDLPYALRAVRVYDGVVIEERTNRTIVKEEKVIFEKGEIFSNAVFRLTEETELFDKENIPELMYTKWFDYDKIEKLSVRNRQAGDFLAIDDGKHKKLKQYLIDQKIPKEERNEICLLAEGSHILWIVGHRISSEYKVTKDTKRILRVDYCQKQ